MKEQVFDTPGPLDVSVRLGSGDVSVRAEAVTSTTMRISGERDADELMIELQPAGIGRQHLRIEQRRTGRKFRPGRSSLHVELVVPNSTRLRVDGGSADLHAAGLLEAVTFHTGSGDASLEEVTGNVDVKVASGDVTVGSVRGSLSFHAASGDFRAGHIAGELVARTASGDLRVDSAESGARVSTLSGDVALGGLRAGVIDVQAVSGDVELSVANGTNVYLDLSATTGSATSDLPVSEHPVADDAIPLELRVSTVSGDIRVRRG
jgi:DUF4097 and DUF4098 domain-containing protein YvlB